MEIRSLLNNVILLGINFNNVKWRETSSMSLQGHSNNTFHFEGKNMPKYKNIVQNFG